MKKLILFLCMILIASSATAADYIELQPGLYKVGEDIATGKYDIRFNDLDKTVSVLYSEELKDSLPDLSKEMSFSFTLSLSGIGSGKKKETSLFKNPTMIILSLFCGTP